MKQLLLSAVVLLFGASLAFAQAPGGIIGVYSDQGAGSCELEDFAGFGVTDYYVVHTHVRCTGSQFMVTSGHLGTPLPDKPVFPVTVGTSATGVSIGYGACYGVPRHILTISFFCEGLTPYGTTMQVVGHPTATPPGLLATDCAGNLVEATGLTSYINRPCNSPVAVEESTWGKVKALFSE